MRGRATALGGLIWILLLGGLGTRAVWADAEQAFKKGLEASDQQDWPEAVEHFRRAAAGDGQESSRRVFISGVFSSPYLPHFYLGWALYRWDLQHCSEALQSWDQSMGQGVVQTFRRQYQDLQSGREACLGQLLPPAVSGAEAVLRRGRNRLQTLVDEGVVNAADGRSVLQSVEALEERLAEARASKDLEALRQITRQAEDVALDLEQRQTAASVQSDRRLENAGTAARRAVEDAERAERQVLALLADPTYAAARRTLPEEGVPMQLEARLDAVQAAASGASGLDEYQAVETEADAVAAAFEASLRRLRRLFDAELRRRAAAPPAEGASDTPGAATMLPRPTPESPPPVVAVPNGSASSASTADDAIQERLRGQTGELLAWVQGATPTGLMALQAQRLEELLDPPVWEAAHQERLEASLGALQLLAAGHAFLRGEPRQTLRWIDLRPLTDSALAVHGHLFAAAAGFDLYRRGGERETDVLDAARRHVEQCRRLAPELEPDGEVFSPAFRSFYEDPSTNP